MERRKIKIKYQSQLADLQTPVGVYCKLRDHFPNSLLLESADYHDRSDSKSFICLDPIASFKAVGKEYSIHWFPSNKESYIAKEYSDVFTALKEFIKIFQLLPSDLPYNISGLWGYSSYEAVQYMEDISSEVQSSELKANPDMSYQLFRYVLVFDHYKSELCIVEHCVEGVESAGVNGIHFIKELIDGNTPSLFDFKSIGEERSNISDRVYKEMVEKGIHHCEIGDVFQIVLSREFQQDFIGDDFNVYRHLRSINPSPYSFYFDYNDFKIFGSSPEAQLQLESGVATINPIAGTVLRGENRKDDIKQAKSLKANPKEMSEHVMLVDLARNDLSKRSSEVTVDTYAETQYFSHVIHLVSNVKGDVNKDCDALDVYADTFPAGTLSGAPKYKALEIIFENEKVTRNFYGGAIGFFGFDNSINHAIIIRSVLSKNNTLVYQAGAGVVVDSTPEGELKEVYNKTAAIRAAIKNANQ